MFSLYPNPNSYANPNPNPNPAISNCYIQACRILAGGYSGISTVSMVRVGIKVTVSAIRGSDSLFPNDFREDLFCCIMLIHTHTHNHFTALLEYVRDHPGEQVPER